LENPGIEFSPLSSASDKYRPNSALQKSGFEETTPAGVPLRRSSVPPSNDTHPVDQLWFLNRVLEGADYVISRLSSAINPSVSQNSGRQ
jgi:hypothetical protein